MKKIMFAAAALAAGVAMADAGLVSSDIVGYAQTALKDGCTLATPQFLTVAGEGLPLQSIRPIGDGVSDVVTLQTLDAFGRTVDSYIWINWAGNNFDQEAWSDGTGAIIENVVFAPGTGLWINGASSSQAIQTAGKVGLDDLVVTLRDGCTAVGNPFPVEIDLQDILPQGDGVSDVVTAQTLDAFGRTVDSYIWINWAGDNYDQEAWSDGTGAIIQNVKIAPGQGLWVNGGSTSQSLRFPAPELN